MIAGSVTALAIVSLGITVTESEIIIPILEAGGVEDTQTGDLVAQVVVVNDGKAVACTTPVENAEFEWLEMKSFDPGDSWRNAEGEPGTEHESLLVQKRLPEDEGVIRYTFKPELRGAYLARCCAGRGEGEEREERCGDHATIYLSEPLRTSSLGLGALSTVALWQIRRSRRR